MRINLLLLFLVFGCSEQSGIPIWELISREEKLGRIFSVLIHMVDLSCKFDKPLTVKQDVKDCQRTLTLHGVSVLIKKDNHALDLLDPYQRLGQETIWRALMEPKYKLPVLKTHVLEQQPASTINLKVNKLADVERLQKNDNVE